MFYMSKFFIIRHVKPLLLEKLTFLTVKELT